MNQMDHNLNSANKYVKNAGELLVNLHNNHLIREGLSSVY